MQHMTYSKHLMGSNPCINWDEDDDLLLFHLTLKSQKRTGSLFALGAYAGRLASSEVITNDSYHD